MSLPVSNVGSLEDLQRSFQDYLFASSDRFAASVRETRKADRETLLGVYRDGYALRLIEVLTNDYPGLMAMAGPDDFDFMARAYIAARPSTYRSVRWFGQHLPAFLAATEPFNRNPAVAEMARFEWALGDAFDAPDEPPIGAEAVMGVPPEAWETLTFKPISSLQLLDFTYEVAQAWQHRDEQEPGNLEVEFAEAPTTWVIWRPEFTTNFRSMAPDEAAAMRALAGERAFPEICEGLVPFTGEDGAANRAAGLLRAWVEEGMIGAFRY